MRRLTSYSYSRIGLMFNSLEAEIESLGGSTVSAPGCGGLFEEERGLENS